MRQLFDHIETSDTTCESVSAPISSGSATEVKDSSGIVYMVSNPAAVAVDLIDGSTTIMQVPADSVLCPAVPIYFGTSIKIKSAGAAKTAYIMYE
jgi:hypothetical protein